jgi:hypothetical protein
MRFNSFLSMVRESFDHIFIIDKRGKMVFFPWGAKKQGYLIKDVSIKSKIKNFYYTSFSISLVVLLVTTSKINTFWAFVGLMIICLGGWYFVYYLYTAKITKSLSIVKESYKEIILEKLEPDDVEEPT